ncbi:PREDICTED: protein decapping 5 [Theobroma cacao]|uniref:Protein decapping 5 n=1 Tax=Theobroma cacao TaxID=3641 RepID=A0AB32VB62_THECC|nr:PREDICTED: protein decapping 5 [Theobroma cacao]
MATTEASQSADSYVGSFISLISKSEIRYEGVLFRINPHESSIGLKNVRSFGTEGRKKDGPQVLPSDKVYDYIYFRGSDIKDLQVLSSLSVQSVAAIPDDPAIIQSHYQHPAASSSLPHSSTSSMTSFSSNSQLALPSSNYQGSVPQYHPVGHMVSWGSSTPPTVNSNEHTVPMYWQGLNGPSGGYSYLHPSLLRPPPGLLASPGTQQMEHSTVDASIPSGATHLPEIPHLLLPTSSASSLNSTLLPSSSASSQNSILFPPSSASPQNSTMQPPSSASSQNPTVLPPSSASTLNSTFVSISSSALHSKLPIVHAASLVSNEASNYTAYFDPNAPGLTLSSNLSLASSLTSSVDTNNIALQFGEKSKSTLGSTSSYPNMPTPTPPIVGTSGSNQLEVPTPSLVTPGQLLQSAPTSPPRILSSSLPLQTAQKDIEVVQTSTLEPLSTDADEAQAPMLPTASVSSGKMNEASLDSQHHDKGLVRGRRNGPHVATSHTHRIIRGHVEERENNSNRVTLQSHHTNKVHVRGRRNGLYGTASHFQPSNRSHTGGMEKMNGTAPRPYYGSRGRAQGRTNGISLSVTEYPTDFDFEAMNEKFNKEEVWNQLGKSSKGTSEDNGDADDSQEDDRQHEDAEGLLKADIKPVYVKDEFFDSLSSNTFDHKPKKGRSKFSEQKKLDAETFGGFHINRGGHGGRRAGHGGWSRGSRYGRGYEHGGRGQGRAVWSRVT